MERKGWETGHPVQSSPFAQPAQPLQSRSDDVEMKESDQNVSDLFDQHDRNVQQNVHRNAESEQIDSDEEDVWSDEENKPQRKRKEVDPLDKQRKQAEKNAKLSQKRMEINAQRKRCPTCPDQRNYANDENPHGMCNQCILRTSQKRISTKKKQLKRLKTVKKVCERTLQVSKMDVRVQKRTKAVIALSQKTTVEVEKNAQKTARLTASNQPDLAHLNSIYKFYIPTPIPVPVPVPAPFPSFQQHLPASGM